MAIRPKGTVNSTFFYVSLLIRRLWRERDPGANERNDLNGRCLVARHHRAQENVNGIFEVKVFRIKACPRHEWICLVAWLLSTIATGSSLPHPVVLTQLPAQVSSENQYPASGDILRYPVGEGARIVLVEENGRTRILTTDFHSAADPDVSFDGKRIVFAGKKSAADEWNVFEIGIDGRGVRQITRDLGDCRSPVYLSTQYTIISTEPWYQIAFTSTKAGNANEYGHSPARHLYSCLLDGSGARRLTFNLSSDIDPFLLQDGRLLFSSWQRSTLTRGNRGRMALFTINNDGTDVSLFSGDEGVRIKHMPCTTTRDLAVFVEAEHSLWDGAGRLSAVALRRPLHSHRVVTDKGLFHSPSPLPDGGILVSKRPSNGSETHGVYRLEPDTGEMELIFDDPSYHDIQSKLVRARPEPDGRSSVVTEEDPYGRLYCMDVSKTDLEGRSWMTPENAVKLRVLEGVAPELSDGNVERCHDRPPLAQKRVLGVIPLEPDGSFYIKVPANTSIQLQVLDENSMALRTCSWIWAKNHEPRGCIGCHEDPELTPENRFIDAVKKPPIELILPPEKRRTVDFRRDIMPLLQNRCALAGCHVTGDSPPWLDSNREDGACFNVAYESLVSSSQGKYVNPGEARTSPLIWSLLGKKTSRPWDPAPPSGRIQPMPPPGSEPLTSEELQTIVEWIDLGALWDGVPHSPHRSSPGDRP